MPSIAVSPPGQPDIEYKPNRAKFEERGRRRKETEELPTTLPPGFPTKLDSPLAWKSEEVENGTDWIYTLNDAQLVEIDDALKAFKGTLKRCLSCESCL